MRHNPAGDGFVFANRPRNIRFNVAVNLKCLFLSPSCSNATGSEKEQTTAAAATATAAANGPEATESVFQNTATAADPTPDGAAEAVATAVPEATSAAAAAATFSADPSLRVKGRTHVVDLRVGLPAPAAALVLVRRGGRGLLHHRADSPAGAGGDPARFGRGGRVLQVLQQSCPFSPEDGRRPGRRPAGRQVRGLRRVLLEQGERRPELDQEQVAVKHLSLNRCEDEH